MPSPRACWVSARLRLDRWVRIGDVPILVTPTGRHELPLRWLVESIEAVGERRLTHPDDRHPLGSVLRAHRSEARGLSASTLLGRAHRGDGDGGHRHAELRSLAYHRAVAQRLDEEILRDAQDRLARWQTQARIDPRYARRWQTILAKPLHPDRTADRQGHSIDARPAPELALCRDAQRARAPTRARRRGQDPRMKREELEHVIRAAATVAGESEIVVVGSQAILGQFPDAPDTLLFSQEADVYPREQPQKAIEIDGAMGDGSQFHETFGYYAHGVGPETAKAPAGWQERLIPVHVPLVIDQQAQATGWCMEAHDLVLAKLAAGRERDLEFAVQAIRNEIVRPQELLRRVPDLPLDRQHQDHVRSLLESVIAKTTRDDR